MFTAPSFSVREVPSAFLSGGSVMVYTTVRMGRTSPQTVVGLSKRLECYMLSRDSVVEVYKDALVF